MQETRYSCVGADANGRVFGVTSEGVIAQFSQEGIRRLAITGRSTGGFDDCEIDAIYDPTPPPPFSVEAVQFSDCGTGAVLKGGGAFGVARLDRRRVKEPEEEPEFEIAFLSPAKREGEAAVVAVRWFRWEQDALCVLRSDETLSVYDAKAPEYPERVYSLKRYPNQAIGIPERPCADPVDFAFSPVQPWGAFTVLVLYSDGCLYAVCPILPTGEIKESLLRAAACSPVKREVLKTLVSEVLSQGSPCVVQHVPVLQGPLNAELRSQWEDAFGEVRCDKAVALACASHVKGCSTVTIGTASGILYSHACCGDILPQFVPPHEAHVTLSGTRICTRKEAAGKLRLMDVVKLQKGSKKRSMALFQEHCSPEMAYCQFGSRFFRIQFWWVSAALLGECCSSDTQIWEFTREARFLGKFQSLDASIAVFQRDLRLFASIFRPSTLAESQVERLPIQAESNPNPQCIGDLLSGMEGLSSEAARTEFLRYEYLTLDAPEFDPSVEAAQDRHMEHRDQLTEAEQALERLDVEPSSTVQTMQNTLTAEWPTQMFKSSLDAFSVRLDEAV